VCGIFGTIGDASDPALRAACAALRHRGPDASGLWLSDDEAVGLAHTRLAVIDLGEGGAQPMRGGDERVVVTFNGEIYNHRALQRELEGRGHRFRSRSDTEAIVRGYEEWGDAVVERLDGMFAFAIWDGRRRRLLAARDRTGKKPLFFTHTDGALRFASEVKALVAAGLRPRLDESALPFLLAFGYVPAPRSIYDGVAQLGPGERLTFELDTNTLRVGPYWQPTFRAPRTRDDYPTATKRVRELVIAAVERRLESDVPLGAFLSGGLDSTIVVGVMARLLGRRVRTFSIGFSGDPRFDETRYARIAAEAFGTDHTEFRLEPASFELVDKLVWLHDGPFGDSSAIPTATISRLMREHVTVALSGDGGDELFCGYLRFLAAEALERIPRLLRAPLPRLGARIPGGYSQHSLAARARRFLLAADTPLAVRIARWSGAFAEGTPDLLRPELRARVDADAPLRWYANLLDGNGSALQRLLGHNFRAYLAGDLHVKVDRCSAGQALEVRSPLLDTALVEYAGTLPDGYLRRATTTKRILRDAFADLVPAPILTRGKMGFGVPLAAWFRGDLTATLRERLLSPRARLTDYVRPDAVRALVEDHLAGRADHAQRLFTLLTLESWLGTLPRPA
jgi:asparagine synthase (glutamine-hydrolysing)